MYVYNDSGCEFRIGIAPGYESGRDRVTVSTRGSEKFNRDKRHSRVERSWMDVYMTDARNVYVCRGWKEQFVRGYHR